MKTRSLLKFCAPHCACELRTGNHEPGTGFTLIEVVIVLTILAVLAAATVPTFRGLQNERIAREPIAELLRLGKEARLRAMKERKPYQVAITAQGFTASRYFDPYLNLAELTEFLALADEAENQGLKVDDVIEPASLAPDPSSVGKVSESVPASNGQAQVIKAEWNERYTFPEGCLVALQFWHESVPVPVEGEMVKLWVFQPNGMCEPVKVQLQREKAKFDVEFSALTADIVREASEIQ